MTTALAGDDPAAAMGLALADLARLLGASRCTVLTPFGSDRLCVFASSDMTGVDDFLVAVERYPELAHVLESGDPVLVRDVSSSEMLRLVRDLIPLSGTTSIAATPLRLEGIRGILRITSTNRAFAPADLERLSDAARVIERVVREHPRDTSESRSWRQLAVGLAEVVVEVFPDGRIVSVHRTGEGALAGAFKGAEGRLLTELLDDPEGGGSAWLSELLAGRAAKHGRALSARIGRAGAIPVRARSSLLRQIPPRALIAVRCAGRDALDGDRVFNTMPLPMLAVDRSGTVVLANRAAEDSFGGPWHDLIGRRVEDLIRTDGGRTVLRRLDGREVPAGVILSEPGDSESGRLTVVAIDDRSVSASGGREVRLEAIAARQAEQITSLRRQIEELSSRRTIFLSSWAHELKTPLTVLQVYLETLRDDIAEGMSDDQISFIEICHDSVLRLRQLVLDLVDLAALDSGKVRFDIGRVEIAPLLEEAMIETHPLAERAEITTHLGIQDSPAVRADAARLLQVVRNLLQNAVKFTAAGGTITLRSRRLGDSVEIAIVDSGIGIPTDRLSTIFDEFVRFHPGGGGQGSGLGLSISRRLVEALGGQLSVESEVGRGSTFAVRLPVWPGD
jgi:PAS domain S-box-containing protein